MIKIDFGRKKHRNSGTQPLPKRLKNLKKSRKDTGLSQKGNDCIMHG